MAKPHWFPFYVSDFLSSPTVTMMSAEEVGGYVLLLCYAWQDPQGSLPSDDDSLRTLSRVKGDLSRIKSCFTEKKGRLYNARLAQELEKAKEKSELARHSIAIRWNNERNTNVVRTKYSSQSQSQLQSQLQPQLQSQSESQSESEKKTLSCDTPSAVAEFEVFWNAYPRKVGGKKNALKAWEKAKDRPVLPAILAVIDRAKQTEQWTKDGGQFIPYPATWLNRGMWADDVRPMESALVRGMNNFLKRHQEVDT